MTRYGMGGRHAHLHCIVDTVFLYPLTVTSNEERTRRMNGRAPFWIVALVLGFSSSSFNLFSLLQFWVWLVRVDVLIHSILLIGWAWLLFSSGQLLTCFFFFFSQQTAPPGCYISTVCSGYSGSAFSSTGMFSLKAAAPVHFLYTFYLDCIDEKPGCLVLKCICHPSGQCSDHCASACLLITSSLASQYSSASLSFSAV